MVLSNDISSYSSIIQINTCVQLSGAIGIFQHSRIEDDVS
jgi:hypothetical protein